MTADNAAAVIEELSESWRVERDGSSARTADVKIKIRQEAAITSYGHIFVSYLADRQSADLVSLVVQKPDGRRVTLDSAGLKDVPPQESGAFEAPAFSDLRIKQVTVPDLGVGDEISYRVVIREGRPEVPGEFWTEHSFTRIAVVLHESFEISWPKELPLAIKVRQGSANEATVPATQPGWQIRRWEHSQATVGKAERKALARAVVQLVRGRGEAPDLQISTFRNWDEVASWFGKLTQTSEQPSDTVKQKALEIVAGAQTLQEKLRRLHKFVSQDVRYVSLAFGPGRYQPRPAPLVLGSSYGDCKDKHSLLAALARSVGLEVRPVLIASTRLLDPDVPSPAQFDHVISRTDAATDAVWLDATAAGTRPGELVRSLRGKQALLITPDLRAALVMTPEALPTEQRVDITVEGSYSADGTFRVKYRRTQSGDKEIAARAAFRQADEATRRKFVESLAKADGLTGTIKVLGVSCSDVRDLGAPFWYEYSVQTEYQSPLQEKAWTFWPLAPALKLPAPDSDDAEPLDLGPVASSHVTVRYELPRALSIKPPLPVSLDGAFATYRSSYSVKDGILQVERTLATRAETIPVSGLPAYKAFVSAVNADHGQDFAVAATTVLPGTSDSKTVDQLMAAGHEAETRGDFEGAAKLFRQATTLDPKHEYAWNGLGWDLVQLNKLDEAVAAYNTQIEVSPYNEYSYDLRGLALWRQRKYDEAAKSFSKQIEIVPLHKWAHTNLGLMRLDQKQYPEAVESLERGVSISPDDLRALDGLARGYLALHRTRDALATFAHEAEVSAIPGTWNNIAWWLADENVELDRALEFAEKAVNGQAALMNARSLQNVSVKDLAGVFSIGSYWDTLGWVYFKKHQNEKALEFLEAAFGLRQDPLMAQHLGQVYEAMGRRTEAVHAYRIAFAAGKSAPELSAQRLKALAPPFDPAYSVDAIQGRLATMRTWKIANSHGPATAEVLVLVDGTGKVLDARFLKGDESLKAAASGVIGLSSPVRSPEGASLTLLRRAALTCGADGKCSAVFYLPGDVRTID